MHDIPSFLNLLAFLSLDIHPGEKLTDVMKYSYCAVPFSVHFLDAYLEGNQYRPISTHFETFRISRGIDPFSASRVKRCSRFKKQRASNASYSRGFENSTNSPIIPLWRRHDRSEKEYRSFQTLSRHKIS